MSRNSSSQRYNLPSYSAHGRFASSSAGSGGGNDTPDDEPGFISSNSAHGRSGGGAGSSSSGGRPPQSSSSSSRLPPSYIGSSGSSSRPPAPRAVVSPDASSASSAAMSGRDRPWRSQHGGGSSGMATNNGDDDEPGLITSASVHAGSSSSTSSAGGRPSASARHQPSPFELMASDIEQRLAESKARLNHATGTGSSSSRSSAVVTPTNSNSNASSANNPNTLERSSSSGLNSRWDHFSSDPGLAEESRSATGRAIASAATSAAERQVQASGSPDRSGESVMVLPVGSHHGDRVIRSSSSSRNNASGMDDSTHSTSSLYERSGASRKQSQPRQPQQPMSPQDAIRLQAMQMLQLAGGADPDSGSEDGSTTGGGNIGGGRMGLSRNPRTGGYSAHPIGQRAHASISGLDMSLSAGGASGKSGGGGGYGEEVTFEEEPNVSDMLSGNGKGGGGKSWSSRYSVDRHLMFLTGGKDSRDLMSEMEGLSSGGPGGAKGSGAGAGASMAPAARQVRDATGGRSATGMFRASAYDMKSAGSSAGAASSARDYAHKNKMKVPRDSSKSSSSSWGWRSSGINLSDRSSLPEPPNNFHSGNFLITEEIRRKRRKRLCVGTVILVALAAIIGSLYGTTFGNRGGSNSYGSTSSNYWNVGEPVTFYVTSDVPYNDAEENQLSRDLSRLPNDAEFVVHLGDVGLATTTSCAETMYKGASTILKSSSRAPVFVLPGNQDWNECPNPDAAFDNWMQYFHRFEDNFSHRFAVTRQLGREENFSFLHNGVLFIGLNLVDGTVPDQTEWNIRHQECVQWAEQALNDSGLEEYRAVVILGHARPTALLGDFFWPIINDINEINKPVLYVHGNAMQGWTVYKPFSDASRLKAVELEKGGNSPPVKIRVGMGGDPFSFDRRSSNKA